MYNKILTYRTEIKGEPLINVFRFKLVFLFIYNFFY